MGQGVPFLATIDVGHVVLRFHTTVVTGGGGGTRLGLLGFLKDRVGAGLSTYSKTDFISLGVDYLFVDLVVRLGIGRPRGRRNGRHSGNIFYPYWFSPCDYHRCLPILRGGQLLVNIIRRLPSHPNKQYKYEEDRITWEETVAVVDGWVSWRASPSKAAKEELEEELGDGH